MSESQVLQKQVERDASPYSMPVGGDLKVRVVAAAGLAVTPGDKSMHIFAKVGWWLLRAWL